MLGTRRTVIIPDAAHALSYGEDRRLCLWELKTQTQSVVSNANPAAITDVAVTPVGGMAVRGCANGKLCFWLLPR